tara:strand:+ start:1066 stop:1500 length:435 start_codon:yes stop_codon:yes gene_type:complete
MTPKTQRSIALVSILLILSTSTFLILKALKDNIVFFYSPTETIEKFKTKKNVKKIRIGGLVVKNSLKQNKSKVEFEITDKKTKIKIIYSGILPDLFREEQGVVVEGLIKKNIFEATEVLAKHDENYMPKEVADTLKANGNWKGD